MHPGGRPAHPSDGLPEPVNSMEVKGREVPLGVGVARKFIRQQRAGQAGGGVAGFVESSGCGVPEAGQNSQQGLRHQRRRARR